MNFAVALEALKVVGGKSYLTKLANEVPTSANIESYGNIIKSLSAKRELISASARITEKAFDEGVGTPELLDAAEQEIFALSQIRSSAVSAFSIPTSTRIPFPILPVVSPPMVTEADDTLCISALIACSE